MEYQIRARRKALKMSQAELAQKSALSRATISALESGTARTTTVSTLQKIARSLDTTVADLFFEHGVQNIEQQSPQPAGE